MRKTKSLQEILQVWMKNSGKETLFYELQLQEEWHALLGDKIQSKTKSIKWLAQEGIVLIKVKDPLLRNELNYAKESILQKLNAKFPAMKIEKILIV